MTTKSLVGLEWCEELEDEIVEHLADLPLLELIPENFFAGRGSAFLDALARAGTKVMVHSVELSVGTEQNFKQRHFDEVRRVMDRVNTVSLSDHLCFTEAAGIQLGQLTPLPWTIEVADVVSRNIERLQSTLEVPVLIENISNRFMVPLCELSEPQFIDRILRRTGCDLLLDLTNTYTNSVNFGFDPYVWLQGIDLSRVSAIHLAGGVYDDEGTLMDSHSGFVADPSWDLYDYVCSKAFVPYSIVEWTDDTRSFGAVYQEVQRARSIVAMPNASFPLAPRGPLKEVVGLWR